VIKRPDIAGLLGASRKGPKDFPSLVVNDNTSVVDRVKPVARGTPVDGLTTLPDDDKDSALGR